MCFIKSSQLFHIENKEEVHVPVWKNKQFYFEVITNTIQVAKFESKVKLIFRRSFHMETSHKTVKKSYEEYRF